VASPPVTSNSAAIPVRPSATGASSRLTSSISPARSIPSEQEIEPGLVPHRRLKPQQQPREASQTARGFTASVHAAGGVDA
jgi:hypothetical protein